jgi:hypothetical protein
MNDGAALTPLSEVGPLVGRRDRRAVLGALADLGVPVVKIRSRYYVRRSDVEQAVAFRLAPPRRARQRATVALKPGERLWS